MSANLSITVQTIAGLDLDIYPVKASEFPIIGVKLLDKDLDELEEYSNVQANRAVTFRMQLDVAYMSYQDSDTSLGRLVRNVESNIRNNINLSSYSVNQATIITMLPGNVTFNTVEEKESAFNKSASVQVEFRCYVKIC